VENVDTLFNQAVGAGGKVVMPVADMFWGDRTGQISDPSGHCWSLATHKKDLTPKEIAQGAEEFFASLSKA
jgi:PhnB protein